MTKQELEKEARKLYRRVYAETIGRGCGNTYAGNEADNVYSAYVARFKSHVTPAPEPVSNPDKLPHFTGPDWSKAPEWANWCAQDENGDVWWYQNNPCAGVCVWVYEGYAMEIDRFAPTADWKNAIWQRPTE